MRRRIPKRLGACGHGLRGVDGVKVTWQGGYCCPLLHTAVQPPHLPEHILVPHQRAPLDLHPHVKQPRIHAAGDARVAAEIRQPDVELWGGSRGKIGRLPIPRMSLAEDSRQQAIA